MIDPVFLRIGDLEIRYYGLIYAVMFTLGLFMIIWLSEYKRDKLKLKAYQKFNKDLIYDYMVYIIISTLSTARLFHVIFYGLNYYLQQPLQIFAFWNGGMSIHGGILGGTIATLIFCKKRNIHLYDLTDLAVIPLSLGLAVGRIGNFINQELYGRITTVPWAVEFDTAPGKRHPSQLYESFKNLIIFLTLLNLNWKKRKKGVISWTFILMYGILRFIVEYFREPEIIIGPLTMGQILSIPMIILGSYMLYKLKTEQ